MHQRGLRELTDTVARLLTLTFERPWWSGDVAFDRRKANVPPNFTRVKRRSGELRAGE